MKIPNFQPDLSKPEWHRRYRRLQFDSAQIVESEWLELAMLCRFDPRFAEIWINSFAIQWVRLSPMKLNSFALKSPWPSAYGVLLEFVGTRILTEERKSFLLFKKISLMDVHPSDAQQFFIAVVSPASEMMWKDTLMPSSSYWKWGYFGSDDLSGLGKYKIRTELSQDVRKKLAKTWAKGRMRFKVSDYVQLFSGRIQNRQAQRDIRLFFPEFQRQGQTRGAIYVRKLKRDQRQICTVEKAKNRNRIPSRK